MITIGCTAPIGSGGGGGGAPNLQAVTTVGNFSFNDIKILDGASNIRIQLFTAPGFNIKIFDLAGESTTIDINKIIFFQALNKSMTLQMAAMTGNRVIIFPDKSGTVALLSDIVAQTLQQVTTAGNTTTHDIIVEDGTGQQVILHADANVAETTVKIASGTLLKMISDGLLDAAFFTYTHSAGGTVSIIFNNTNPLAVSQDYNFRPTSRPLEDIAYLSDLNSTIVPHGNKNVPGFTGAVFSIIHGLTFTPTYAQIVAKNGSSGIALSHGYFVAYTPATIDITLNVPVGVGITLDVDWFALQ